MTKIKVWHEGISDQEAKEIAYYERNMIALRYAEGWYYDEANNWPGWKRVLCLDGGKMNFHIPDDFDIGDLDQLPLPCWDGHTTEQKWERVQDMMGVRRC